MIRSDCQWCHQCWHHQYQCHQCHQCQLYHLRGAAGRSGLGVTSKKDIDSLVLPVENIIFHQFPGTAVCFLPSPVDVRYRKEGSSHGHRLFWLFWLFTESVYPSESVAPSVKKTQTFAESGFCQVFVFMPNELLSLVPAPSKGPWSP